MTGFAYVGCRTTPERQGRGEGLGVWRADGAGWSRIQLVRDLVNPSFLAFGRGGRTLHVVHGDESEVSAFRIDPATGTLAPLGRRSTEGRNPVHLAPSPDGAFLIVANYAAGSLALFPVAEDGGLEPICDLLALPGAPGPDPVEQAGSHPHQVLPDPGGRFFIVPDKGLDKLFVVAIDTRRRRLELDDARSVPAAAGAAPRHGAFHPTAKALFIVNELDSTVAAFRHDGRGGFEPAGVASTLPPGHSGANSGAGIVVTPSGRHVFVSNRGHDSLAGFAVEPGSFALRPIGWTPSGGPTPRFIGRMPGGGIVAANEAGDSIVSFRVDEADGALHRVGEPVRTGSPVCVLFSAGAA